MTVISNPLLLKKKAAAGGGGGGSGDQIAKSLRFNSAEDTNLKKAFATKGNQLTWTYSAWVKNCKGNSGWWLIGSGNTYFQVVVDGADSWIRANFRTASTNIWWDSGRQINDPGAWYHVLIAVDYTQSVNTEKVKLYINGDLDPTAAGQLGKNYHSTNQELLINQGGDHYIGSNSNPDGGDAYLADVQFIDGLQLSPHAFLTRDDAGVVHPKTFALPTINDGTVWSTPSYWSGTEKTSNPYDNGFDGDLSNTIAQLDNTGTSGWINYTFTPPNPIKFIDRVEIHGSLTSVRWSINGEPWTTGASAGTWDTIATGGGTITTIDIEADSNYPEWRGIRIDGVILRDGITDPTTFTNPNNNTDWASKVTFNNGTWNANSGALSFDGKATTSNNATESKANNGWATLSLADFAGDNKTIEVTAEQTILTLNHAGGSTSYTPPDTSNRTHIFPAVTLNSSSTLKLEGLNSGSVWVLCRVKVDGVALVNSTKNNSFHLKFDDASTQAALGTDSLNSNDWTVNNLTHTDGIVTVANGTPKPIYQTTGDQGETKVSPTAYNSDSSAGTTDGAGLVLAWPGTVVNGDEHDHINTESSAKTVAAESDAVISTSVSRHYGSSGYCNKTSDCFRVTDDADLALGSGDYTVEMWHYPTDLFHNAIIYDGRHPTSGWPSSAGGFALITNGDGRVSTYTAGGYVCHTDNGVLTENAWYHIAVVRSSGTQKIYINGIEKATASNSTNHTEQKAVLGAGANSGEACAGYFNDWRIYKGTAKYTSAFEPPSTGNPAGLDSLTDTPTNYGTDAQAGGEVRGNFCTLNPLDLGSNIALSQGNLTATISGNSTVARGTIGVQNSGKWYFEVECKSDGADNNKQIGVHPLDIVKESYVGADKSVGYHKDGRTLYAGDQTGSTGSTWGAGDTIGVALDLSGGGTDNGKVTFYKNGTAQSNGIVTTLDCTKAYTVAIARSSGGSGSTVFNLNTGQRAFKNSAPAGHKCLCTQNLDDTFSGDEVNNPSKYFDAVTYTGAGTNPTTQAIKGVGFQPDLLWIKNRDAAVNHWVIDAVRGKTKILNTNSTADQGTDADAISSFNSDGFTLGDSSSGSNGSGVKYVSWLWDAGTAANTSTNTNGDNITVAVGKQWVNTTAGFSITEYGGDGSGAANNDSGDAVGHGLSAKPDFIVIKKIDGSNGWPIYHSGLANSTDHLNIQTSGAIDANNYCYAAQPTNTKVELGNNGEVNSSSNNYIMYCWNAIAGYSSFGTYVGSSGEPFVYLGFSPKWFLLKRSDNAGSWYIFDSSRDSINPNTKSLKTNSDAADGSYSVDFLSNGVRINSSSDGDINGSGANYIYAAFAEHPFKTARAVN